MDNGYKINMIDKLTGHLKSTDFPGTNTYFEIVSLNKKLNEVIDKVNNIDGNVPTIKALADAYDLGKTKQKASQMNPILMGSTKPPELDLSLKILLGVGFVTSYFIIPAIILSYLCVHLRFLWV